MTRTDASKSRATHVKLTRDFRWVETKFKNIQLENKQRRNVLEAQRIAEMEERNRRQFEQGIDSNNAQLQMQLQDQVSVISEGRYTCMDGWNGVCEVQELRAIYLLTH